MSISSRWRALVGTLALSVFLMSGAHAAYSDPPGRVARLSDSRGDVSYSPAGESEWLDSVRNRPLIRGDRLWTSRNARVELQVGSAAIRLGENTSLEVLDLSDQVVQLRLTQGTLNAHVRRLYRGQTLEIATPTLAFVIDRAGNYRIDVDPRRDLTTVVVWDGAGQAYGENASFPLRAGDAVRFYSDDLRDYQDFALPRADDFDRYCSARDERLERSASLRYVDDDLIGYADLDEYGSWSANRDYGNVWFPTQVRNDWAPYRDGHWVWQEPWGWTWVDDAPWGFAPSHYGRWVSVSNRWGWIPGPRNTRPIYAPALVAFVGGSGWSASISVGSGSRTGWFPLGPREAYLPSYHASREYFTQINVNNTVINNTTITNVYNNYSNGRIDVAQTDYRNRSVRGALTAVPNEAFVNAKPVRQALIQLDENASRNGEILQVAPIAPSARSVLGLAARAGSKPEQATFNRQVIARNKPAADALPFAAREQQLQRHPGKPVDPGANGKPGAAAASHVRVVSAGAAAINARELGSRRIEEKPGTAPRKPGQLKPLDRSVQAETALKPQAVVRERDQGSQNKPEAVKPQSKPGQSKPENDQRQQAAIEQKQRDEQARQQQNQRQEQQRQQAANEQKQRDEQARQQQNQRQEQQRQQAANEQKQRDQQAREQQNQRKEQQRQQAANEQKQRDQQAREQQNQRQEQQRQQAANEQKQRDQQARQQQQQQQQQRPQQRPAQPQQQVPQQAPADNGKPPKPDSRKGKDKDKEKDKDKDKEGKPDRDRQR